MSGYPVFCTSCFAKLDAETQVCPACGARLDLLSERAYRDKLIQALMHPLAEVRMRAIIALGWRAEPNTAKDLVACAFRHPTDVIAALAIIEHLRAWPPSELRAWALRALSGHPSRLVAARARRACRFYKDP